VSRLVGRPTTPNTPKEAVAEAIMNRIHNLINERLLPARLPGDRPVIIPAGSPAHSPSSSLMVGIIATGLAVRAPPPGRPPKRVGPEGQGRLTRVAARCRKPLHEAIEPREMPLSVAQAPSPAGNQILGVVTRAGWIQPVTARPVTRPPPPTPTGRLLR